VNAPTRQSFAPDAVKRNRLTRITTRGGDKGESGLGDGSRHSKTSPHFHTLGDVDELNCAIGIVVAGLAADHPLHEHLLEIQSRLFDLGGAVALPRSAFSLSADVLVLDRLISDYNARLGPLANFILPGGTILGAQMHFARAVCRRAERSLWELTATCPNDYDESLAVFLNRLSDVLFVFARVLNEHTPELLWQQRER
jgi:cob(I)alamin adenosyltransferase